MQQNKTIIIIAGPTAVGKTSVAIEVAKHFGTEIISADSRQCFKELQIGVARPSIKELAAVPHYFIATHSIQQKVTAATFEEYALEKAAALFLKHDVAVMVGGTGLYIKAFCEGMDEIPEVPLELHNEIVQVYNQQGLEWLQEEVKRLDTEFWQSGETQNPQRLMRALEVVKATGKSILHFRKGAKKHRDFNIIKVALELPKETLHHNINHRVDKMIQEGLVEEVQSLLAYRHLNALQTVGYKELFACCDNDISLPEAIEAIKRNTRRYAKRQLTWFRKDNEWEWILPDAVQVIRFVKTRLA
ncbi:MAG: miaA [Flavisolibacter sp.]|nr:miaA [Flavisolibacter sp.]